MVAEPSGLTCTQPDKAKVTMRTIKAQTKPFVFCDVVKKTGLGNSGIGFQCQLLGQERAEVRGERTVHDVLPRAAFTPTHSSVIGKWTQ